MKFYERILRIALIMVTAFALDQVQFVSAWLANAIIAYLVFTVWTGECIVKEYLQQQQ